MVWKSLDVHVRPRREQDKYLPVILHPDTYTPDPAVNEGV